MKVTKIEKIWIVLVVLFYIAYNFPGIPALRDSTGMFIHAVLTVVPIWILVYWGMIKVYKQYKLKQGE